MSDDFHCSPTSATYMKFFQTMSDVSYEMIGIRVCHWPDNLAAKPKGITISSLMRDK